YGDAFAPAYIKSFTEQYPNGHLVKEPFGNGDEAVAKMQAGFQADVVNSCVDENTLTMVQNGLYQPLDTSRIPDWNAIFPAMKTLPGVQVDGQVYMIPVDAGTAGIMSLFKSGEVVISSGYPGNAKSLERDGVNVKFAVANEGQMLWTCGYGIQTGASNIDAAYALLNWYLDWHQELFEAKTWNYEVANQQVLQHASAQLIADASLNAPNNFANAIPASPPQDRAAWTQAWQEVKAA